MDENVASCHNDYSIMKIINVFLYILGIINNQKSKNQISPINIFLRENIYISNNKDALAILKALQMANKKKYIVELMILIKMRFINQ